MLERGWIYDESDGSYYLPDGVYDPFVHGSGIMTMEAPEPYFPDFDYKKLPWYTFPEYVQKYVYMPFKWDVNNYEVPFVLIRVTASRASVFVGYNLGFGYDVTNDRYRVCSPYFTDELNSVCYYATFNSSTYKQTAEWQQLSRTAWGDTGKIVSYSSNIAFSDTMNDYYFYGGAGVRNSTSSVTSVSFPLYSSGGNCYFRVDNQIGYQSGQFFYMQSDASTLPYGQYFVPPSAAEQQAAQQQQQIELQQESNETQSGIWETLKKIPEMIADKIKSLFVPEEGYFDEYIDNFETYFSDCLGIIYELPEAFITIIWDFVHYNPRTSNYGIDIPEVILPVKTENGGTKDLVIFEAQFYAFDFLNEGPFATLYEFYRGFVWVVVLFSLIAFSIKKFNELTGD